MRALGTMLVLTLLALSDQDDTEDKVWPKICSDEQAKRLVEANGPFVNVANKLVGKTFVDIWTRQATHEEYDCIMTRFVPFQETGLMAMVRKVRHRGQLEPSTEYWTENGEGIFTSKSQDLIEENGPCKIEDYHHMFYADDNVFGYFSCGAEEGRWRIAISMDHEKIEDPKAKPSLTQARAALQLFADLLPEDVMQLNRRGCPLCIQ